MTDRGGGAAAFKAKGVQRGSGQKEEVNRKRILSVCSSPTDRVGGVGGAKQTRHYYAGVGVAKGWGALLAESRGYTHTSLSVKGQAGDRAAHLGARGEGHTDKVSLSMRKDR